jgi:hypothetical protein
MFYLTNKHENQNVSTYLRSSDRERPSLSEMDASVYLFIVLNPLLSYAARYLFSGDGQLTYTQVSWYTASHMCASLVVGATVGARTILAASRGTIKASVALGMVEALSVLSNNAALAFSSIFTNQSIKSLTPLCLLILQTRRISEIQTTHLAVPIAVVSIWNILTYDHTLSSQPVGVLLSTVSMLLVVARMRLQQSLLYGTHDDKRTVLFYQSLAALAMLTVVALSSKATLPTSLPVLLYVCATATVAAAYNTISLVLAKRYSAIHISLIALSRQCLVIVVAMFYDVGVRFLVMVNVLQMIGSLVWYGTRNVNVDSFTRYDEDVQGQSAVFVKRRWAATSTLICEYRAKAAIGLLSVASVCAIPAVYEASLPVRNQGGGAPALNVTVDCNGTFDGTAPYEIVVSRYDEKNVAPLLRAARELRAPITFYQAIVSPTHTVPDAILQSTTQILNAALREPRCIRFRLRFNLLDEIGGYLAYVIERYDTLPRSVVMFKGSFRDFSLYDDVPFREALATDDMLPALLRGIDVTKHVNYASLPTVVRTKHPNECTRHFHEFRTMIDRLLARPSNLSSPQYCFLKNQFIVSSAAIRNWPLSLYERLLFAGAFDNGPAVREGRTTRHQALVARQWLQWSFEFGGAQALFGGSNATNNLCLLGNASFCAWTDGTFIWDTRRPLW